VKSNENESGQKAGSPGRTAIHGAHLRTLEALFRHPSAHNLEWMDVVALIEKIVSVHQKANDKFAFDIGGEHYQMREPHTKDLTGSEVVDLRHFLQRAGWSPEEPSHAVARPTRRRPLSCGGGSLWREDLPHRSCIRRRIEA
jgi:hypothetical protein